MLADFGNSEKPKYVKLNRQKFSQSGKQSKSFKKKNVFFILWWHKCQIFIWQFEQELTRRAT
jgi:hypothetical protein